MAAGVKYTYNQLVINAGTATLQHGQAFVNKPTPRRRGQEAALSKLNLARAQAPNIARKGRGLREDADPYVVTQIRIFGELLATPIQALLVEAYSRVREVGDTMRSSNATPNLPAHKNISSTNKHTSFTYQNTAVKSIVEKTRAGRRGIVAPADKLHTAHRTLLPSGIKRAETGRGRDDPDQDMKTVGEVFA